MATQQQAAHRNKTHAAPSTARTSQSANVKSASGTTQATQPAMPHYLKKRLSPIDGRAVALYSAGFAWLASAAVLTTTRLEPVDIKHGLIGVAVLAAIICIAMGVASDSLQRSNSYRYIGKNDARIRLLWNEIHKRPEAQREPLRQALALAYGDRTVTKSSATLAYGAHIHKALDRFFIDATDLMPSDTADEQPFANVRRRAAITLDELLQLDREHQANQQIARETSAAYDEAANAYHNRLQHIDKDSQRRRADNIVHRAAPQPRLSDDEESFLPGYNPRNLEQ